MKVWTKLTRKGKAMKRYLAALLASAALALSVLTVSMPAQAACELPWWEEPCEVE